MNFWKANEILLNNEYMFGVATSELILFSGWCFAGESIIHGTLARSCCLIKIKSLIPRLLHRITSVTDNTDWIWKGKHIQQHNETFLQVLSVEYSYSTHTHFVSKFDMLLYKFIFIKTCPTWFSFYLICLIVFEPCADSLMNSLKKSGFSLDYFFCSLFVLFCFHCHIILHTSSYKYSLSIFYVYT